MILNLQRFAGDVAEEGPLAHRLELFGPERERLDREGQLEVLGDVEDLLYAISSRSQGNQGQSTFCLSSMKQQRHLTG